MKKEILSKINIPRVLKYTLFLFLSLVAQNMLFTQIRPLGICPMVLPAVAVAVGMFEGSTWGTVFSLVMGIFADMAFVENTVAFTLLFPAISFASGFVSQFFINRRFFAFMGTSAAALLLTGLLQLVMTFASDGWSGELLRAVFLQTLWSLPPSALAYLPPAKWID